MDGPRIRLDCVEVEIRNVDVPRLGPTGRQIARVMARAAVVELVAAAMRKWEGSFALADAGQHAGEILQALGDLMGDLTLTALL